MHKIALVEDAKTLLTEAQDWSVWRWLTEKRRVRSAADQATGALDELERTVKAAWSDDLKKAYHEAELQISFESDPKKKHQYEKAKEAAKHIDPETKLAVQRVKAADDEAENARLDAEATFAEAERRMSAGMAREGAQKAIGGFILHEKAIRRAEALARKASA